MTDIHTTQGPLPDLSSTAGWDLIAAAQRGDRDAFGRLYGRYVGLVFGFVLARVSDWSLAEDLTSETFLRAWRGIGSVRDQGRDVSAWLVTIARNLVRDHIKSSRYRREVPTAEIPDTGPGDRGPEQVVIDRDTATQLAHCLTQLSPAEQQCLVLRFGHGLPVDQTAAVMGRSADAVKQLRHRALHRLRQQFDQGQHAPLEAGAGVA